MSVLGTCSTAAAAQIATCTKFPFCMAAAAPYLISFIHTHIKNSKKYCIPVEAAEK